MELQQIIENFMQSYGLISIFLIVALEYANLPLPSEIVLPFAGILALEYNISLLLVILVSICGGLFGSIINYYLGFKLGKPLLSLLEDKYPKTKSSIKASYGWLTKYEKPSVMLSRLIPLARTFISVVAGVTKMGILSFSIYSTIGIAIWNTLLITLGYIIGDNMSEIGSILKHYTGFIGIVLVISIILIILISRIKKSKKVY